MDAKRLAKRADVAAAAVCRDEEIRWWGWGCGWVEEGKVGAWGVRRSEDDWLVVVCWWLECSDAVIQRLSGERERERERERLRDGERERREKKGTGKGKKGGS